MSEKYRVKLSNNRIVGPFTAAQISELFERGHITDTSPCQTFPAGEWKNVESFQDLKESIIKRITGESLESGVATEATIVNLMIPKKKSNKVLQEQLSETEFTKTSHTVTEEEKLSEFKFDMAQEPIVDYDELEKKYQEKIQREKPAEKPKSEPAEVKEKTKVVEEEPGLEKTRVFARKKQEELDKTRVITREDVKIKANVEEQLREKFEAKAEQVNRAEPEEEKINTNEATEFINLNSMLPALSEKAQIAEKDIVALAKQKELASDKNETFENDEFETEEDEEDEQKKKGMKPIVLIAFLAIFYVLFFDEEEEKPKPIEPKRVEVVFPTQNEYLDEVQAQKFFQMGLQESSTQTYLGLVRAAGYFRQSLHHKFQDNQALGHLILSYARLFPNAKNRLEASTTLFNLVRLSQDKILTDPNVVIGTAEFYLNAGKNLTAVNVIENYLRVSKTPTVTMLSVYLEALVKSGRLADSKGIYEKLQPLQPLPIDAYENMAEYLELDEKVAEAQKVISDGLEKYPQSVRLLLKSAEYSLKLSDLKGYEATLKKIDELKAEQCPTYYASFLEHMGNAAVLNGKFSQATAFYGDSLKIRESSELRTRLANLNIGGDNASKALIQSSQIFVLMKKARQAMRDFDWEGAFVYAIEASDLNQYHIEANLLLVEIQIKRGYLASALSTLQRLKSEYPTNTQVSFKLVETFLASFRFNDAITTINEFAQIENAVNTPTYASMLGDYYYAIGNDALAVKWLTEATNRDPLADDDLYDLARIYVKNGKYKDGKMFLTRALMLDPVNLEYQNLYAQILYDQDGADTAIGYLRDLLSANPQSPQIMGEIAKYYYKSGQVKEFENFRKKIEDLNTKDEKFYEFLIYASEINGKLDKVLEYAKELTRINPGDVRTYIKIGDVYMRQGKYSMAVEAFEKVKLQLENYPKINYQIAMAFIEMGKLDKALEHAELEIKGNPKIPQGYYAAGLVYSKMPESQANINAATKQLERAVTIDYGYIDALIALGNLKRRQNNFDQARELLLRALKVDNNNPIVHKELGYVYRAVGQGALAAESFQTYLTLLPGASDRSEIEALIRASR